MKKSRIIGIVIIILLFIAIGGYVFYQKMVEEGRKYEVTKIENPQYFLLKEQEKYGVMNAQGEIVLEPNYDNIIIPNPEKAVFICYQGEDTTIYNANKEEILTDYTNVEPIRLKNIASSYMYEKTVLIYEKDGKKGLVNLEGKEIAKPVYEQIEAFPYKEGELLVKQEGKYGVINIKGNILVNCDYDQIAIDNYYTDENGYQYAGYIVSLTTQEGYRYGYVDIHGKEILKPEYNELSRMIDIKKDKVPYFITAKNGQYGVFKEEEQLINNEYQSIRYDKSSDVFVIEKSKKYGVANREGKTIIPVEFSQIDITGMYLYARKGEVTEVYDQQGNLTNRDSNIDILPTENQQYSIKIDNSVGTVYSIVDKNENPITKTNYSYIEYLFGDYFIVSSENGKLGVIDTKENLKLEIKYDSIERIPNTELLKAMVTQENLTQIYTPDLSLAGEMINAVVETNKQYIKMYNETQTKYFDITGKEVQNKQVLSNQTLFAKEKDGKWGFVDSSDNFVIENKYDKVTDFNSYGFAGIKLANKWGVVDRNGNVIVEPEYEFASIVEPSFIGKYYQVTFGFGEIYYTDGK